MIIIKRALIVTRLNLIKHIGTIQFWAPFILAIAAVYNVTTPLLKMAEHYNSPVNGFSVAFLFSDKFTVFIFFIGAFILYSDLPFKDNQQCFLLVRSGKMPWIISQILYIIIVTILYFSTIINSYLLFLLPHLNFDTNSWGKIINTIGMTNADSVFELKMSIPKNVLLDYAPNEAFLYAFLIVIYISVVIGMIIFVFNLVFKYNTGIIIGGFLIFLYLFVSYVNAISEKMFYLSPLGWCSLIIMDKNGVSSLPTINYAVMVLSCSFLLLTIMLIIYGIKKSRYVFS